MASVATAGQVNCSIAAALGEVGERWSLLIIREALMGSARFDEFHQRIGVARNILNDRLASLVKHGVMTRTRSPDNARIYHYTLTEKGLELLPVLIALMQWGDRWIHSGIGAPIVVIEKKTGKPIHKVQVFGRDGGSLAHGDVEIAAGPGATESMRQRLPRRTSVRPRLKRKIRQT